MPTLLRSEKELIERGIAMGLCALGPVYGKSHRVIALRKPTEKDMWITSAAPTLRLPGGEGVDITYLDGVRFIVRPRSAFEKKEEAR